MGRVHPRIREQGEVTGFVAEEETVLETTQVEEDNNNNNNNNIQGMMELIRDLLQPGTEAQ